MTSREGRYSELLLGIDIGTSSSKAVLARPDGSVLAAAQRPHGVSAPRPGWVEHDAEAVWWSDLVHLTRELLPCADAAIASICVSGIGPCVLPASRDGAPLRPAILYGVDTRAAAQIEELTTRYGASEILERCGSPLTSQAVGPKLAWLRSAEPEVWQRTRRWFMASSYLVHRLTGEYVLDHHSASQSDPLYHVERRSFDLDWTGEIAPGLELPRLAEPAEIVGRVRPASADATGLVAGTPVCAGTIDALAEATSVGVERAGDLMLMYGSTVFMIKIADEVVPHPKLWTTTGIRSDVRCVAAGMATGGSLVDWFRKLAGEDSYDGLVRGASQVPAGADGLLVLPYFAGERTPLFDHLARGVVCGLTLSHERAHVCRAIMEGVAYGIRHNLETMVEASGPIDRIVCVGGGTTRDLWPQIVSDTLGLVQHRPEVRTGACYGDALLAGRGAGLVRPETQWNAIDGIVRPDAERAAQYDELYPLYRQLYPATRDVAHGLAKHQYG